MVKEAYINKTPLIPYINNEQCGEDSEGVINLRWCCCQGNGMMAFMLKRMVVLICFLSVFSYNDAVRHIVAQSPAITFENNDTTNNFPYDLTFSVDVSSSEGEITTARLYYALRNATSTTQQVIEFEAAEQVTLNYTWDTSNVTMPPSAPIFYHWEVTDSAGNRASSEELLVHYDDVRYEWQVLADENLSVWWHDRLPAFGERVFVIAQRAFEEQQQLFQAELDYPIRIIIYNDFEEFAAWHSVVNEFVGGQAFSSLGITTQIVIAYNSEEAWLNNVIPHEISHLYFYQATYHPLNSVPLWLNEGVAQYNEFEEDTYALAWVEEGVAAGELLPLWTLSGSFGSDETKARFAYAESLSAVLYMVERYGEDGMGRLLAAFREGLSEEEAIEQALGQSLISFQQDWITWLGVSPDLYPTPTPEPTIALPPTPAMMVPPTARPSHTPEATATATLVPTAVLPTMTPTLEATRVAQQEVITPSPLPATATPTETPEERGSLCASAVLLPVALLLVGGWLRRKSMFPLNRET